MLLCFRGIAREHFNDLSYDGCHNMKWLTTQESPFISVLIEKLVFSELGRKYAFLHGTRNWLPCYQEHTNCSYCKLFDSIHYTILRFNVILFFHLPFFHPSDLFPFVLNSTLMNALLNSLIAVTCSPNHHLCSCLPDDNL